MNNNLCCPICKNPITAEYYCEQCRIKFPAIKNIPILINEKNSIFSLDDYNEDSAYSFFGKEGKLSGLRKLIPNIGINYAAQENYELLSTLLLTKTPKPKVLIIGGGVPGKGMNHFLNNPDINFTHTDVSFTSFTQIICDCHDLPFSTSTFDGVIVQAVLEHVIDPHQCVEEIHRVLSDDGFVYAETPFMQQVHGGAYDFTRYTWLGHRRLFRKFEEIKSGTCGGPGMALAWSWAYFFRSFTTNPKIASVLKLFSTFTSFYWKYFDLFLKKKSNTLDAASGNYFIGTKKADYLLNDKELIKLYKQKKQTY